ncbi:hypothetical protein Tco_1228547 [Tanacetum coccineum]
MNRIIMTQVYAMAYLPHYSSVIFIATCSYSNFKDSNDNDESSYQTKIHFRNSDNQELSQRHPIYDCKWIKSKPPLQRMMKKRRLIAFKTRMSMMVGK